MGLKTKLKYIAATSLAIFSLGGVVFGTFAWFQTANAINTDNYDIDGRSATAYYASGTGAEDDPYIITTFTHLRNLAWLQYNGNYSNSQKYFKLGADIDCTGKTLPPIGTEENPFIGNFDGDGYKISNLTVSNKDIFEDKPADIEYLIQPEIVGLFGVVGKYNGKPALQSYSSSINELKDFVINGITVESKTTNTLVGLAAGYVNANISDVSVKGTATLDVGGQTHTAKAGFNNQITDYGLVGYTTKTGSSGSFSQELSEYYSNNAEGSPGDGWGGSVNAKKNMQWLYYMKSNYTSGNIRTSSNSDVKPNEYPANDNGYYRIKFTTTFNLDPENVLGTSSSNNSLVYQFRDDSYLPLTWANDDNSSDSYKQWSTASVSNTGYIAGLSNTGMQGTPKLASYPIRNIAHSLSNCGFSIRQLYNNNPNTGSGTTGTIPTSFTESNFNVLTYSTTQINNSNWVWIYDNNSTKGNTRDTDTYASNSGITGYPSYPKGNGTGQNGINTTPSALGLTQYQYTSEEKPGSLYYLKQNLTNAIDVHGLMFDFVSPTDSSYKTLTGPVRLKKSNSIIEYNTSGSPSMNFRIPKGAIDFNLNEDGYVNLFAASMYNSTSNGNTNSNLKDNFFKFFSLYHVTRTESNGTSSYSLKEIYKIYKNSAFNPQLDPSSSTNPRYVYSYNANDTSLSSGTKGDLLFDVYSILNGSAPVKNAVYYFEFPLNDGEYAMGRASSTTSTQGGSYLLYLDIAASGMKGTKSAIKAYHITSYSSVLEYPVGIDFAAISVGGDGGESISVSIGSSANGVLIFTIAEEKKNQQQEVTAHGQINISDQSSISSFSYQGNKYSDSDADPPDGMFKVTGDEIGNLPTEETGGTRELIIDIVTSGGVHYVAKVIDVLNKNGTTIKSSTYALKQGDSDFASCTENDIQSKLIEGDACIVDVQGQTYKNLRNLNKAATLTRSGDLTEHEFTTEYNVSNCSSTIVDVTVTTNGATISVAVESGYTLKIGGISYPNQSGSTYPLS